MGIELIHDKDPLAFWVLCKGLLDVRLKIFLCSRQG